MESDVDDVDDVDEVERCRTMCRNYHTDHTAAERLATVIHARRNEEKTITMKL